MYEIPTSMPQPTDTVVKSGKDFYGRIVRSVESQYVISPADGSAPAVVVSMTTYHYGDRKQFRTSITWTKKKAEGQFSVITWGSDHKSVAVHNTPVARYSKKAMEAHHDVALAVAADYWHDGVSEVFSEAASRNGLFEPQEA